MTQTTLEQLAAHLEGTFTGNPSLVIQRVVHPLQANSPEDMALVLDDKILPLLAQKPIATALVPEGLEIDAIPNQIKVKRPKVALARLLEVFDRPVHVPTGIHPSSAIDPTASIEEGVAIGPLCSVGPNTVIGKGTRLVSHVTVGADARLGENCIIHAGVRIGDRVQIGNRVILQPNASIGGDGYSYVTPEVGSVETARAKGKVEAQNNEIIRINSVGTVVLEDDVEIGANTCVDRATLGETRIKRGTKIDNLVQVAHNVTIGENCLIVGQVGIAGSVKIGDRVVMGGQVGMRDHITIGDDAIILPQSGVTQDLPGKALYSGAPAVPHREFLHREMQIKRIKTYHKRIDDLTKRLEALEAQNSEVGQPV